MTSPFRRLAKLACPPLLGIALCGCSAPQEYARNACYNKQASEISDCLRQVDRSYDQFSQERKKSARADDAVK